MLRSSPLAMISRNAVLISRLERPVAFVDGYPISDLAERRAVQLKGEVVDDA